MDTFHAAARCEMFRISEKMYLLLCKPLTVSTNLKNFQFMKKDQNTENSDSFETKNTDVEILRKANMTMNSLTENSLWGSIFPLQVISCEFLKSFQKN